MHEPEPCSAARLRIVDLDGSDPVDLTDGDDFDPSWSPDGSSVVFTRTVGGNADVYVIDADGSNLRRLTNDPAADRSPAWSPDGSKIAFQSGRDGNEEVYVINVDGTGLVNVTRHPGWDGSPAWRPQGAPST
jgi:Tol biopolymer transport system component